MRVNKLNSHRFDNRTKVFIIINTFPLSEALSNKTIFVTLNLVFGIVFDVEFAHTTNNMLVKLR